MRSTRKALKKGNCGWHLKNLEPIKYCNTNSFEFKDNKNGTVTITMNVSSSIDQIQECINKAKLRSSRGR